MALRTRERRKRASWIMHRVAIHGRLNRCEVATAFSCSSVTASAIMTRFHGEYPGALNYDKNRKAYLPGPDFDTHLNNLKGQANG